MVEVAPLDMRNAAFRENPYPALARLRELDPVHRDAFGLLLVTRHEDVVAMNRDRRLGRDLRKWMGYEMIRPYLADTALERCVEQWMFSLDPPEHTRLRKLVQAAFRPKTVSLMADVIATIADELLDEFPSDGDVELMAAYARPLPVRVIGRILSIPPADDARLREWSDKLAVVVEPTARRREKQTADTIVQELSQYLDALISAHTPRDEGDLLGDLIRAEEDGDRLGRSELIANLVLLLVAGHETTTNLIGNGALALMRHPEQLRRLRETPDLMASAIEEMLRYEVSANTNARVVHEDIVLRGTRIEAGQMLLCMLGAANRDPAVFERPDDFDVARDPNPHVSFGGGVHYCVGAPLARLEAQIAFERLLQRFPKITLRNPNPPWRDTINLRGLAELTLRAQ